MRKLIVLLAACALVVSFTLPAMAQEGATWNFWGRSQFSTWIHEDSKERYKTDFAQRTFDDTDLIFHRSVNTSIGASVDAGDVGGLFELCPSLAGDDFQQMYGTWNFGTGTLLIGKTYGPGNIFGISNQRYADENSLFSMGGVLTYAKPMIQVSFGGDWGAIKIAAIEPETASQILLPNGIPSQQISVSTGVSNFISTDQDTALPKLEASYSTAIGPASIQLAGGWQEYEVVRNPTATTEREYDVDSHFVGLGVKLAAGPAYINGSVFAGQNLGQYQFTFNHYWDDAVYDATADTIIDCDTEGFAIAAGIKVNDMISFEAGYGWAESDLDSRPTGWGNVALEDDIASYYIQAKINAAKGVTITPEIGKVDAKESGMRQRGAVMQDEGDTVYYGIHWQINF